MLSPRFRRVLIGCLAVVVGVCVPVDATTWRRVSKPCPIDGTLVEGYTPRSTYIDSLSADLRPSFGVDLSLASLLQCPECGYCASPARYDRAKGIDRAAVLAALRKLDRASVFYRLDAAMVVEHLTLNRPAALAHLHLAAKWRADDTGEPRVIAERTDAAIAAHKKVLESERDRKQHAASRYLIGEMLRQQGRSDEAIVWFDRALPGAETHLKTIIYRQRAVAARDPGAALSDDDIAKIVEMTFAQRLAYIPALREIDRPAAVAALRSICLHSHLDMREPTMHALIAEALENPVNHTKFALREALAELATEEQIPALVGAVEGGRFSGIAIRGLLNTGSTKAIGPLLDAVAQSGSIDDDLNSPAGWRALRAGAKIPGLLEKLPPLATDSDTHRLRFKAYLLEAIGTPARSAESRGCAAPPPSRSSDSAINAARRSLSETWSN